jgi:PKD repeat protein
VEQSPPTAQFVFSPSEPTTADTVEFDGRSSSDPDSATLDFAWAVDGGDAPAFADGDQPTFSRRFAEPGEHRVSLRVTDADGNEDVVTRTVTVKAPPAPPPAPPPPPNAAPKASMLVAPRDPDVGQTVTLTSTSTDTDGRIARIQWDVDNDGQFSDGEAVATTSFSTPGNHVVALKVFDNDGASATAFETVTVKAAPAPLPKVTDNPMINPFPVIRIRGVLLPRGVRLQILSVRAQPTVRISVRCLGRGCPRKEVRTILKHGTGMRIKQFERTLPAGVRLEVRVTRLGWIGKYTKFTIRKRAAPRRVDLCVGPVSKRPVKCAV